MFTHTHTRTHTHTHAHTHAHTNTHTHTHTHTHTQSHCQLTWIEDDQSLGIWALSFFSDCPNRNLDQLMSRYVPEVGRHVARCALHLVLELAIDVEVVGTVCLLRERGRARPLDHHTVNGNGKREREREREGGAVTEDMA